MTRLDDPALKDEACSSVILAGGVHHREYVHTGATTSLPDSERPGLCGLLMVLDGHGWATLHRVEAIRREPGRFGVTFGPRVPWSDGTVAARNVSADPEIAAEYRRVREGDG